MNIVHELATRPELAKLNQLATAYSKRIAAGFKHSDIVALERITKLATVVIAKLDRKAVNAEDRKLPSKADQVIQAYRKAVDSLYHRNTATGEDFCRADYVQGLLNKAHALKFDLRVSYS